jgi:hypothetical protein
MNIIFKTRILKTIPYVGENEMGTISLLPAKKVPIESLFGAWEENGNDDKDLQELYQSRIGL